MQLEEGDRRELLLLLVCSWLFFPFMLKPLWPSVVVGSFLAILVAVAYVNRRLIGSAGISVPVSLIPDALLYFLYFLGLAAATLIAQDGDAVYAMFVIILRIVLFALILCLINEKTVIASLDLYTSIIAALCSWRLPLCSTGISVALLL